MTILILSAGKQKRWAKYDKPKQLLELCGETIMARQLRQLHELCPEIKPMVFTRNKDIMDAYAYCWHPPSCSTILHTLLCSISFATDKTIVLLGDVFYEDSVLKRILSGDYILRFWIGGSEIFALTFASSAHERLLEALCFCLNSGCEDLRLWHLLRRLSGLYIHDHVPIFNELTDHEVGHTADVDSERQYEDLKQGLINLHLCPQNI